MRITGLEIYSYGKFSGANFKIDPKLHVFLGPNESGKTTLFDFITQVLFGFASNRYPEKRHENHGSVHGGKIFLQDPIHGAGFVERIGQKKVRGDLRFSFEDGYGGGEEEWAFYSHHFTSEAYESLFALDLDNLEEARRQEDRDLETLFLENGLLGNHRLKDLQAQLNEEADFLYLEKSYARPLDKKIQELESLEEQVQKSKAYHQDYLVLQAQKEKWAGQQLAHDEDYVQLKQKTEILSKLKGNELRVQAYLKNKEEADNLPDGVWVHFQRLDKEEKLKKLALDRAKTSRSDLLLNEESKLDRWRHSHLDQLASVYSLGEKLGHLEDKYQALHYEVLQTEKYLNKQMDALGLEDLQVSLLSKEDLKKAREVEKRSKGPAVASPIILSLSLGIIVGILSEPLVGLLAFLALGGGYLVWAISTGNNEGFRQDWQALLADHRLPQTWSVQDYEDRMIGLEHLIETRESYDQVIKKGADLFKEIEGGLIEVRRLDFPYSRKDGLVEDLHSFLEASRDLNFAQNQESKKGARLQEVTQEIKKLEEDLHVLGEEKEELIDKSGYRNGQELQEAAQKKDQVACFRKDFFNELDTIHRLDRSRSIEDQWQEVEANLKDLEAVRLEQSQLGLDLAHDIQTIEEGSAYANLLQDRADKESEVQSLIEEWLIKKVAASLIDRAFEDEANHSLQKLLHQASAYLKTMTQNVYDELSYSEETIYVHGPEETYPLQVLSKGTQDQVYISMKLAFIMLKAEDYPFPVLLDDPFVNFDAGRRKGLVSLIKKLSADKQFIVFTMDQDAWNSVSDESLVML